jgi:hypothetical protein
VLPPGLPLVRTRTFLDPGLETGRWDVVSYMDHELETLAANGLASLERYLEAQAALENWCAAHPEEADAVRSALADLRARRERGEL